MPLATSEERDQVSALKTHQRTVRGHKSAKKRVDALAEALADAQTDHAVAGTERASAKDSLLAHLSNL